MNAVLDNIKPLCAALDIEESAVPAIALAVLALVALNRHWPAIREDLAGANGQ